MNIALLGYGVEGESAYRYFKRQYPDAHFAIYDNATESKKSVPDEIEFRGGVENFFNIEADIVVKTPAIRPSSVSSEGEVTTVTKEFFKKCPAPIIGVTGTKGKGTTCTLIAKILEAAGKKVWLVGNMGAPALDVLDQITADDIVVYEMSSFQLWDMEVSPHIAVVLLIEADHLNVHKSMDDYIQAKANIVRFQHPDDSVIYHPTNSYSAAIADLTPAKRQRYLSSEGAYIANQNIIISEQKICAISDIGLPGLHNIENVCAALTAAWHYTQDIAAITSAIKNFTGLPHHIEKIREVKGVTYYDDSYSSATMATVAAVKSFQDPVVLILGGFDRGIDIGPLVEDLSVLSQLKHIIAIGETGVVLASAFKQRNIEITEVKGAMDAVVKAAEHIASSGDVVLLSPGFASFDQYKNFIDRGEKFQEEVNKL